MAVLDHDLFLCADDVAALFHVSRTKVYKEASVYIASGGRDGIPAVRIGRSIRFLAQPIRAMAAGSDAR